MKEKNHTRSAYTTSTKMEFDKNPTFFHDKKSQKTRNRGEFLNMVKRKSGKPKAYVILHGGN